MITNCTYVGRTSLKSCCKWEWTPVLRSFFDIAWTHPSTFHYLYIVFCLSTPFHCEIPIVSTLLFKLTFACCVIPKWWIMLPYSMIFWVSLTFWPKINKLITYLIALHSPLTTTTCSISSKSSFSILLQSKLHFVLVHQLNNWNI